MAHHFSLAARHRRRMKIAVVGSLFFALLGTSVPRPSLADEPDSRSPVSVMKTAPCRQEEPPGLIRPAGRLSELHLVRAEPTPPVHPPAPAEEIGPPLSPLGEGIDIDLKPIGSITANIIPPTGELPADRAASRFAAAGAVHSSTRLGLGSLQYTYYWRASAFCHQPLYFEETNLERYGRTYGALQPVVSAAHFFCTVPAMPYLLVAEPPHECVYALGHSRPGDPYARERVLPPWSTAAALTEAGVVVGLIALIP